MAEHKRLIEWGKDFLILLLTCSAVFLVLQTPMAAEVRGWITLPGPVEEPEAQQRSEAVEPYALAVRSSLGLYGVSYDKQSLRQGFALFVPLLGEALASGSSLEPIQAAQWRQLLESPGVYCVFQGTPPLSVLGAFLGQEPGPSGKAQSLLLAWDGSQTWLAWRDGTSETRMATNLSSENTLRPLLEEFSPNGAALAYTLAASDDTYAALDPYVLVSMTSFRPQTYTAASPNLAEDAEALGQLLDILNFQSGMASAYESGGELALNESGDRLRVGKQGQVTFHAGEETRFPVATEGLRPTAPEAASAAWDLLNRIAAPWKGELSFLLTDVTATSGGWTLTFHARLEGLPVATVEEGWCARFTVEERKINGFTLTLRSYTPTGELSVIPSERLAAAALRSLPDAGGTLTLTYNDTGASSLSALWLARD